MTSRKQSQQEVEVSKAVTDDITRMRLGEMGYSGLKVFNGVAYEELQKELNHPNSIKTYKLMSYHPSVNAPLNLYNSMVSKLRYRFVPPKNATEEEKKQTEIIESMFNDMEHSLEDFIAEAMTCTQYGWAINEKVFRKRTYSAGSKYNDGLIGIKKLPLRAQESIKKFIFDDTGNNVIGVVQSLDGISDPYNRYAGKLQDRVLPRQKFMLFTLGKNRSNPYGTSPLRDVYIHWKYLQAIEELEAQSVVKDVNGLPVLTVPVQYMSADASPEQKAQLEVFKNIIRNLQQGSQSGVVLPSAYDPETRHPLFKLDLLSQDGKKNFDLNKIKEYYRAMIFIGMGADILLMGNTNVGSFALGSIKNTLTAATAEVFIKRIIQVINDDLIVHLYSQNGWDISRCCKIDYEDIQETDLDSLSKAYQRLGATGYLPKTLNVINRGLTSLGVDPLPESTTKEELEELLPDKTTRSGDSLNTSSGGLNGTAESVAENDSSSLNSDNAA